MGITSILKEYQNLAASPLGLLQLGAMTIVLLSVLAIFVSVLVNFLEVEKERKTSREKKSIVETGTMAIFFFIYYLVIRLGIGFLLPVPWVQAITVVGGLVLIVIGAVVNVKGRFSLGRNWANQIKIYEGHTFVQSGVYRYVRHPLYASLIWMFFGGALVYTNYLAFLLNLAVFIPFMHYRARQEELLLDVQFKEYREYREKTGMFFPKLLHL